MKMKSGSALVATILASSAFAVDVNPEWSIARQWDEQLLYSIRRSTPRPPVHARNLYHISAAMYDGWATYDSLARGVFFQEKHTAVDVEAARRETISYAAYRIIKARFVTGNGPNIVEIQASADQLFADLGYDKNYTTTVGNDPAAIGNRIASIILSTQLADGSNEAGNYAANNGYLPTNAAMPFKIPGCIMQQPSHWQPLAFDFLVLQNGEIIGASVQQAICPHWAGVTSFALNALDKTSANPIFLDKGTPPGLGDPVFVDDAVDLIAKSSQMDPRLEETIDISPAVFHNSPLGSYEMQGWGKNPVTGEPYPPNVVKVGDYVRVLAEFWADGPDSETPPGHWHVVANDVADTGELEFQIGGSGPTVDRLEWDAKMYVMIAGAAHDAAVTAWGHKGFYDSARPISAIRYLGTLGQSSDPEQPSYHPNGLPLIDGLIEIIQPEDVLPGGRFEDFPEMVYDPFFGEPIGVNTHVGELAVKSWLGGFSAGTTSGAVTTGPLPGHVYRGSKGWLMGEFDLGLTDSPGALNAGMRLPRTVQISEIRLDQPGNDTDEYFELIGPPNTSLNGLTYIVVGDEVQTAVPDAQGHIQVVVNLDGLNLGPDGVLVVGKTNYTLSTPDLTTHFVFKEIGNCTHMLVSGFTGYNGQELDFLDNGVLDIEPWTGIVDSIALRRKPGSVGIYSSSVLGPAVSADQLYGTGWLPVDRWMPYQASNFVTPPFPGYISGHSTFSRATARALTEVTGSPYFPNGLGTYDFPVDWLKFEHGPSEHLQIQWTSYFDASDESGVSRLWGGIHPRADDLTARVAGDTIGKRAAARAFALFSGLANSPDLDLDGLIGPSDLALFLGTWGGDGESGGDFDGDGEVGPADLAILLGSWGI